MLSNAELKLKAYSYGWDSILSHFGVDTACLDNRANKRSYCPLCGGDKHSNHFDYRNKSPDETYHCFKCGGGDGFKLLYQLNGTGFGAIAKLIRGDANSVPASKPVTTTTTSNYKPDEDKAKKLVRLKRAIKYSGHTPKQWGIEYLAGRGIKFRNPIQKLDFVRYGSGYYMDRFIPDANGKPTYHNCLLFPLSVYESKGARGLVRIYVDMNKVKLAIRGVGDSKLPSKPMLSTKNLAGAGVWFSKTVENVLHVGEGIENTLSILQSLKTLDGVASVTAGLMGKLVIPPHITEMHIWKDSGNAGTKGARELRSRYETEIDIIIHAPPDGMDWNDILRNDNANMIQDEFYGVRL